MSQLASTFGYAPASRRQIALFIVGSLTASFALVSVPNLPAPTIPSSGSQAKAVEGYGNLPISFEPNVGQAQGRFDFVARGQGFGMLIRAAGATLSLGADEDQDVVQMDLIGANRSAPVIGLAPLPGKANYFIGSDRSKWQSGIATFGRVSYRDVLPGVGVTYYGTNDGTLEYDFSVAPEADPEDIRIEFSGADTIDLQNGSLVIKTESGAVRQEPPVLTRRSRGAGSRSRGATRSRVTRLASRSALTTTLARW